CALLHVGAGDAVALARQQLGDSAHADAACADEVDALDPSHDLALLQSPHAATIRSAASGRASRDAAAPIATSCSGRAARSASARSRSPAASGRDGSTIAAPASAAARAFALWWSSAACG